MICMEGLDFDRRHGTYICLHVYFSYICFICCSSVCGPAMHNHQMTLLLACSPDDVYMHTEWRCYWCMYRQSDRWDQMSPAACTCSTVHGMYNQQQHVHAVHSSSVHSMVMHTVTYNPSTLAMMMVMQAAASWLPARCMLHAQLTQQCSFLTPPYDALLCNTQRQRMSQKAMQGTQIYR